MNQHGRRSSDPAPRAEQDTDRKSRSRSHPVGTTVGATTGAVAGAAVGTLFGPIGTLVGAGIGAVAGGGAGSAVSEQLNPSHEEAYWRQAHTDREYYDEQYEFDRDYLPAYRTGWEARGRYGSRAVRPEADWDERLEAELESGWNESRGDSRLAWEEARPAVRDGWNSTQSLLPEDYNWRRP